MTTTWETIYAAGRQLNAYPFTEAVSFMMRGWPEGFPTGFCALDAGCGSGVHAALFARHGAQVTAFDFSPSAIEAAGARHSDENIHFVTADFGGFDPGQVKHALVFDRLSSTHTSLDTVKRFYQRLRPTLARGARVFWQGYDMENSGRYFGTYHQSAGFWDNFSEGVFAGLGQTVFFGEEDLDTVFEGYVFDSKRILSDRNLMTGYTHSYWMLELTAP